MNDLFFENYKHEHISKLACPGCAAAPVCLEESSQVGQCSALGYRGCQIDLPALFFESALKALSQVQKQFRWILKWRPNPQ